MDIPFFGKKSSQQGDVVLLCDIDSNSAAVGVATTGEDLASAEIITMQRAQMPAEKEPHSEVEKSRALISTIASVVSKTVEIYRKSPEYKRLGPIKEAHVMLHASHSTSITRDGMVSFKNPTRVTKEMIEKVANDSVSEEGYKHEGEVFEHKVVRVELLGYPTANPVGKMSTSIRVITLESAADQLFIKAITESLRKSCPDISVSLHSAVHAYHSVTREVEVADDLTFLDIGSDVSACHLVRRGALGEQTRIQTGTNGLIKAASEVAKSPYDSIYSLVAMVYDGTCSDEACEEIAKSLSAAEAKILRTFGEGFSGLINESRLPNTLTVAVHPKLTFWAQDFFSRIDFSQFTVTGRPFQPRILSDKALSNLAIYKDGVRKDLGISVLASFVHIVHAH